MWISGGVGGGGSRNGKELGGEKGRRGQNR